MIATEQNSLKETPGFRPAVVVVGQQRPRGWEPLVPAQLAECSCCKSQLCLSLNTALLVKTRPEGSTVVMCMECWSNLAWQMAEGTVA